MADKVKVAIVKVTGRANGIYQPGKRYYKVWGEEFKIDKKYLLMDPLGMGTYGVVCSAYNTHTSEKVAIKKIQDTLLHPFFARQALREIRLMQGLNHDNILPLKSVMWDGQTSNCNDVYLVSELMDRDLAKIIESTPQVLNDNLQQYLMYQLFCGVKYMHSANVLHRDIKPQNLFVDKTYKLKIGDFGSARTCSHNGRYENECVVTLWYRAPELLLGWNSYSSYSNAIDMWSVGCIFAELLGRTPIFPGRDSLHQLELIMRFMGSRFENEHIRCIHMQEGHDYIKSLPLTPHASLATLFPNGNPLALDLLARLLTFDPTHRITASEALEHPYFSKLHNTSRELVAPNPLVLEFEDKELTLVDLREKVWHEISYYDNKLLQEKSERRKRMKKGVK